MSHIDQALRIRDGASGTPEAESASQPETVTSLHQYPHEDGDQRSVQTPPALDVSEAAPIVRSRTASRPSPPRRARESENPDLQARLVTGAPNTVALEQYRRLAA